MMRLDACAHPFFNGSRDPNTRLPNRDPLPLIQFYNHREQFYMHVELLAFPCDLSILTFVFMQSLVELLLS